MAPPSVSHDRHGILTALKQLSPLQYASFFIILFVGRFILRGIYRVYLHPLSKFPGPRASAFTRLPHIIATAQGRLHQHVADLHSKYGEVVRISPDELSFVHPHVWRDIYGYGPKQGPGSAPPKYWHWYGKPTGGTDNLISTADPVQHARTRKIFLPAFSDRALTQQAPLFMKYVDQLVQILRDDTDSAKGVDMVKMYNCTTFDVMGDITFGEPLHMLDNLEYDPWVEAIFKSIKNNVLIRLIYTYYTLVSSIVHMLVDKQFAKMAEAHFAHSSTRVTKRLEKGRESDGVDIWDLVLQSEDKGKGLTRDQMNSNAGLFMIAGTETTATLLSGLTYLLLDQKDKTALRKLNEEVRSAFSSSNSISMEAIQALPYLNACIKEGLRMYPPVPGGLSHRTTQQGSTICGHFVPPNTTVAGSHWAVYSSPTMFKDPMVFHPERWLGDEYFATDERAALQPFSVGSRDCVGKNMAYHEMRLILAKVVYNFDLELCPESADWNKQRVFILWEKRPLMAKVRPAAQ